MTILNTLVNLNYNTVGKMENVFRMTHNAYRILVLFDSSGLNVPPVSLSNVPGISESNVPPIAKTNVPGVSL